MYIYMHLYLLYSIATSVDQNDTEVRPSWVKKGIYDSDRNEKKQKEKLR